MSFPYFHSKLDKSNLLIFFDMEATEFSQKAIAIGIVAYEKKAGEICFSDKRIDYHAYIKTDEKIGTIVENMTGINKQVLDNEGKDMHSVVLEITKLFRHYSKSYLSYGNSDIRILRNSLSFDDETERNFFRNVTKNYIDLHQYLGSRICSEKGESLSVSKLVNLFHIKKEGNLHNPSVDSLMLSKIYQFYVEHEDTDLTLFRKNLLKNPHAASIYKEVTSSLMAKGNITQSDLDSILRNHL